MRDVQSALLSARLALITWGYALKMEAGNGKRGTITGKTQAIWVAGAEYSEFRHPNPRFSRRCLVSSSPLVLR